MSFELILQADLNRVIGFEIPCLNSVLVIRVSSYALSKIRRQLHPYYFRKYT